MGETYKGNKIVMVKEVGEVVSSVEILVKALGTMVIIPEYTSDPNTIGKKIQTGSVQQPILVGVSRDKALTKLDQLIEQL